MLSSREPVQVSLDHILRLLLFDNVYKKTPKQVFVGRVSIILIFYGLVVCPFNSCLYLRKNGHLYQTQNYAK